MDLSTIFVPTKRSTIQRLINCSILISQKIIWLNILPKNVVCHWQQKNLYRPLDYNIIVAQQIRVFENIVSSVPIVPMYLKVSKISNEISSAALRRKKIGSSLLDEWPCSSILFYIILCIIYTCTHNKLYYIIIFFFLHTFLRHIVTCSVETCIQCINVQYIDRYYISRPIEKKLVLSVK